jgi:hypothetical protein
MQTQTSDLDTALAFVIRQIEDEAKRSGMPLDDEQRYLMTHLPAITDVYAWPDPEFPRLIPRDLLYEKLCALAKAARLYDLRTRPAAANEWEFAAAVLKVNRHPMLWLLKWAGVKERRPWWDLLLLIGASFAVTVCAICLMIYAEILGQSWNWGHWSVFGLGCGIIITCAYLGSRKFRNWQINRAIESTRRKLR